LEGKIHRLPSQISGGEKERVAIARAIVNAPPVLLADEPTGNVDSKTTREVMELFQQLSRDGITIIMVTHSVECAEYAQKILRLSDGRLVEEDHLEP
jgi:ABC-type ATPase involved in cell division